MALLGVVVTPASLAVRADAAAVPRIRIPAIRNLPTPHFNVPRPTVTGLTGLNRSAKYGLVDESIIAELEGAGRGLADDIDAAAAEVGANAEARVAFRKCTGDGLEDAGTGYVEALQVAADAGNVTPAPDFQQVIDGTVACLSVYFPDVPGAMLEESGKYLASLASKRSGEAYIAGRSGAVLAEWMKTTGPELTQTEAEPEETVDEDISTVAPIGVTGSDSPPGEGFPWWAAIAVVVVLGGGAAVVRSMKS